MLVLSREKNQKIVIGPDIDVKVVEIRGRAVRLGITAPKKVVVDREEVSQRREAEGGERRIASPAPAMPTEHYYGDANYITTATARRFWPLDPAAADLSIVDIAHALANTCRYGGHCKFGYSVARHSILVSRNVPAEDALWGLLHDAAEAYLADIPRPYKRLVPQFAQIEERILAVVATWAGIGWPMPASVAHADELLLATEWRQLMPHGTNYRNGAGPMPEPLPIEIRESDPIADRDAFLARWDELRRRSS